MATLETPERSIDLSSLRRWESLCEEIQHPDVELTVEEFAALLSVFKLLRAEGHPFDAGTVALMAVLERQATDSIEALEDDTDSDEDDDHEALHAA